MEATNKEDEPLIDLSDSISSDEDDEKKLEEESFDHDDDHHHHRILPSITTPSSPSSSFSPIRRDLSNEERASLLVSLLSTQCSVLNERDAMRLYIQLCPFALPNSPASRSALKGIEEWSSRMDPPVVPYWNGATTSFSTKKATQPQPPSRIRRVLGITARTLLLDLPLLLILLVHSTMMWIDHVHETYWIPQMKAVNFTKDRHDSEITYYARHCDDSDLTTRNPIDLFLSSNATPNDAYQHQLKHGFTVLSNVLSPESSHALRDHVMSKRDQLNPNEIIGVIENKYRHSFGLQPHEPIVANALMEIGNHVQFQPSIELMLGPDPALLELSVIISQFGATTQHFHEDVSSSASAKLHARTFGPPLSVFIPLQNTTVRMGVTEACPGTHYCADGTMLEPCERLGFPVVDPQTGHWNAGDALMMNGQAFHRGSAHSDPHGLDRVLLVLTFTTKPRERIESRSISQGSTNSIRWDVWGHTLRDVAQANKLMKWPWTTFRALSLYKPSSAVWGIDVITTKLILLVNNDHMHDYQEFMTNGGFPWLPKFLHGQLENNDEEDDDTPDPWIEFLQDTFRRCLKFSATVQKYTIGLYVGTISLLCLAGSSGQSVRRSRAAIARFVLLWFLTYVIYQAALRRVDRSDWAKDIRNERRYTSVFRNQSAFGIGKPGPSTLPNRPDVLIETRLGSKYLGLYEDIITGHPGNRKFGSLVQSTAPQFALYPPFLQNATAQFIVSSVQYDEGRFLYQGTEGQWHWLKDYTSLAYVTRELHTHSNYATFKVMKWSRRMMSEYMYGMHSRTILAQKYSVPYQRELESKFLGVPSVHFDDPQTSSPPLSKDAVTQFSSSRLSLVKRVPQPQLHVVAVASRSPFPPPEVKDGGSSWISEGDWVELYDESTGFWKYGVVLGVWPHGQYEVSHPVRGQSIWSKQVRRYNPFDVDDECHYSNDADAEYQPCFIERVHEHEGTYDISIASSGEWLYGIGPGYLSRYEAPSRDDDTNDDNEDEDQDEAQADDNSDTEHDDDTEFVSELDEMEEELHHSSFHRSPYDSADDSDDEDSWTRDSRDDDSDDEYDHLY